LFSGVRATASVHLADPGKAAPGLFPSKGAALDGVLQDPHTGGNGRLDDRLAKRRPESVAARSGELFFDTALPPMVSASAWSDVRFCKISEAGSRSTVSSYSPATGLALITAFRSASVTGQTREFGGLMSVRSTTVG
jgi:hypothetical protein